MVREFGFTASFLFLSASLALLAQEPLQHSKDSFDTIKENLKAGKAILLDVREQKEWESGHLKAAKLLPLSKLKKEEVLDELFKTLPKDKVIYMHCRAGNRVLVCGEILKKYGFEVRPLKAGYDDLVEAGFEKVEKK